MQFTIHHLLGHARICQAIDNWLAEATADETKVAPLMACMEGIRGVAQQAALQVPGATRPAPLYYNNLYVPAGRVRPNTLFSNIAKVAAWAVSNTMPGPGTNIRKQTSMKENDDAQWDDVIVARFDEMNPPGWPQVREALLRGKAAALRATGASQDLDDPVKWRPGIGWELPKCAEFFDPWRTMVSKPPLELLIGIENLWKFWKQGGNCTTLNITTGQFGPPGEDTKPGSSGCCRSCCRPLHMMGESSGSRCCNL